MEQPLLLAAPDRPGGGIQLSPRGLEALRALSAPVHVVAALGPPGGGSVFLMNQLAGPGCGFPGSPGLWMRIRPHPKWPDRDLLLLHAGGFLGGKEPEDGAGLQLFMLQLLLASVLVYGSDDGGGDAQDQLELFTYAQTVLHHLRLLDEEDEDEDPLLRFVLPPFVWSLRSTALAPESEDVLEAEDHKLEAALGSPLGPIARCVLMLFPEQKLFRVADSNAEGLIQLCTYLLRCDPKTEPGGAYVGGAYLAALAERVVDAMQGDAVLRIGRLCQEAKEIAQQETGDKWPEDADFWQDDTFLKNKDTSDTIPQPDDILQATTSLWHDDTDGDTPLQPEDVAWVEAPSPHPLSPMPAPLCLVDNSDGNKLSVNPEALAVLRGITQPVVVVAIAGPYRTGKSFLMNRLAKQRTGFPLGPTVRAETKGIWMWCLPHPSQAGVALVLLDTEGLGDPRKADSCNDAWIFTLALLLSSTLVYNSIHTTGHRMLEYLWLLMDLRVRVRAQAVDTEPADEFARVFPGFVWVVRDFMMESSEQPISGDEYLERILRPQLWLTMRKYNELQRRLRNFFPHHKLFMLGQPVADRVLAQMEVLRDDQLQPQFRQQEEAFCQHIWKEAPVKVLLNSSQVTGRVLARLAETYMAAITTGSVPCVESALTVVVEAENSTAVEAAVAEYRQGMEQGLVLPTASHDALMAVHRDWKQRAGTFFLSHAFANTRQCYQALLMDKLEAAKEEFCRRNEEASEQRCCAVLRELWGDTELRMKRGDYVVPGGRRLFQEDLKRVLEEYERRPDKGVKVSRGRGSGCGGNGCASWWYHQAEAVLKEFLRVKGLEMMEMWLDWVDQQCKAVLAEVAAATQTVEKKLEKQLEKQLEEQLEEHRQQQRAELTKMRMVKEKVEQRICILEKQQEAMLAEVAAIKKMVEKQLEQQQVVLAEVTAAKKAVEKQQEQQQVALAEVTALQEAAEAQLEERWQRWAQQLQEEQNLVLSQRLQELEARLQEGRGCEAAALQQMQEEDQTVPSWRSTLLKFLDKVVVPILIRLVNSVVNNAA